MKRITAAIITLLIISAGCVPPHRPPLPSKPPKPPTPPRPHAMIETKEIQEVTAAYPVTK